MDLILKWEKYSIGDKQILLDMDLIEISRSFLTQ